MQKELIEFINKNELSPLNRSRTEVRNNEDSIFKTRDAKSVHNKTINKISENFSFADTKNLLDCFNFTKNLEEIKRRQYAFSSIKKTENDFLKEIKIPSKFWKPKYGIVAVTEDEKTFVELKKIDVPVKFINSSDDILVLETYDLVQAVDCDETSLVLERLPQVIFINNIEDVYLERYLEILSGWKNNLEILEKNYTNEEIKKIVSELKSLLELIEEERQEKITRDNVDNALERINENISEKLKNLNITGETLFQILSKNTLSKEIKEIIDFSIESTNLPENIFNQTIPVTIDEKELGKMIKEQEANEYTSISEKIKNKARELKQIPNKLRELSNLLLIFDFYSGISKFILSGNKFPEINNELRIIDSKNIFLDNPEPISFLLDDKSRCSILTGANSGGKTTLLEHIIQIITLQQIGLPISGDVKLPLFEEVYYFAKNKGSASKGAFETLLSQMSKIIPGRKTLILADEIESVTEPGVAGKILCATAEYFIKKGCFLVIATHLGQEVKESLPELARIDGIEAKGLDENYDLIVHHNPILGKLAHSTPELIIEKMANSPKTKNDYIEYIFKWMKK